MLLKGLGAEYAERILNKIELLSYELLQGEKACLRD